GRPGPGAARSRDRASGSAPVARPDRALPRRRAGGRDRPVAAPRLPGTSLLPRAGPLPVPASPRASARPDAAGRPAAALRAEEGERRRQRGWSSCYTRRSFQRPRLNSTTLTSARVEYPTVIATNTP